ncbi:MAG: hypothetical protein Q8P93_03120 [bacterium]|nr:hypothetical protein [bacterium]
MDQTNKFFNKISAQEKDRVFEILNRLKKHDTEGLQIKKLSGHKQTYRVRIGRIRIIYVERGTSTEIIAASYRDSNTYRDF